MPPFVEELVVEAVEPTRTAATSTVLQRALARLVHFHSAKLVGSRFEFFERRDEMGRTMPLRPHPTFGLHVEDLGILLEYTQDRLIHSRMDSDLYRMQYLDAESRVTDTEQATEELEDQLTETQDKLKTVEDKLKASERSLQEARTALVRARKETRLTKARFTVARYWQRTHSLRVDDLTATVALRDERITELEEENQELRKANDDLLPDDDYPTDDMDVDPESDQEDDDLRDDGPGEAEHLVSEEDPDEPPYYGDVLTSPDVTAADE